MVEVLQILSPAGEVEADELPEGLSDELLVKLYRQMVTVRTIDTRMLNLQRQGRIGFYGTCKGQEAATVGSGAAVEMRDWVFPALREGGVLLLRGYSLEQYMGHLVGCSLDPTHGRQMPCHFGSGEHNFLTLSSVIGTQILHAMGTAWAAKIKGDDVVTLGYMGDGATSSTDFHAALTIGAVHKVPCVFFCQNNQWAISVPFSKQTASDGIAVKAKAYGMPGIAVDGNDVLAVYKATREAVERARRGEGPTLIEAITYRVEGHSSSDDATRYRDSAEVEAWKKRDPIERYRAYLKRRGLIGDEVDEEIHVKVKEEVDAAIKAAEAAPPPALETLFTDVYAVTTESLKAQYRDVATEDGGGTNDGAFPL